MIWLSRIADILAAGALLSGGLLALLAGLGLLRLPDVATRLQAATKPQTLGLMLICAGVAPFYGEGANTVVLILVVMFQLTTAPIVAQLVGRSAYRAGHVRALVVDEYASRHDQPDDDTGPNTPPPTL